jgi:hypothetical protein
MHKFHGLNVGDQAYLYPKTLGAPAVCFKQPKVTVVARATPYLIVELPDGQRVEVHEDNVVHTLPRPLAPRLIRRRLLELAGDEEEVPLW